MTRSSSRVAAQCPQRVSGKSGPDTLEPSGYMYSVLAYGPEGPNPKCPPEMI